MLVHGHLDPPSLIVYVSQLIRDCEEKEELTNRNRWENIWISRLNTRIPEGLNIED